MSRNMTQREDNPTFYDSFTRYRDDKSNSVIIIDSDEENAEGNGSDREDHVVEDSVSLDSSVLEFDSSDSYLETSLITPSKCRTILSKTKNKLESSSRLLSSNKCLAPDSDDESSTCQSLMKSNLSESIIIDDSSSSDSLLSTSTSQFNPSFGNSSTLPLKSKSGLESSVSSHNSSANGTCKKHSDSTGSYKQLELFDFLQARPVSRNNIVNPQKLNRERASNGSNSSSSLKMLELDASLDRSHNSTASNISHSSQKDLSLYLTEKQKFAKRIQRVEEDLKKKKMVLKNVDLATLPDKGVRLQMAINSIEKDLRKLRLEYDNMPNDENAVEEIQDANSSDIVEISEHPKSKEFGTSSDRPNIAMVRGMDSVTMDALKNLHDSLKTCPSEEIVVEDPKGLKVSLMPHQRQGLAWMLWREQQIPTGGILADDMGLGKTLSMVSLILKHKEIPQNETDSETSGNKKGGTLVVCPTSLLGQWKNEIEKRCRDSALTVYIHHGSDRSTSTRRLRKYDVVITTYGIVMRSCASIGRKATSESTDGPLHRIEWERIVLDEAHTVRNHKSQTSQAVCSLQGKYRWAVTGTPIHNKELDLYALIVFIRCKPFDNYLTWRRWVDNKTAAGSQRMNMLMKTLILRRTKDQLQTKGSLACLPSRDEYNIEIVLDPSEQTVYDQILVLSRNLFAKFMDQHAERTASQGYGTSSTAVTKPSPISDIWPCPSLPGSALAAIQSIQEGRTVKSHHLLVLLLRLRQICCHPGLIQSMLDAEDCENDSIVDNSGLDVDLVSQMNAINLLENDSGKDENGESQDDHLKNPLTLKNPVFKFDRPSTKLKALIECLEEKILPRNDKAVIVSQWTSMLDLIGKHMKKKGIRYNLLSGSVPLKARMEVIENFNNCKSGPQVLLLSLKAGGVGLNLVGGNHLALVDLHWNPQLEAQACDRIYRVGQKKGVHVYRFVCKHTVEEKIFELQKKKLLLAESVLTGAKNPQVNKLTLEDLKNLFSHTSMS